MKNMPETFNNACLNFRDSRRLVPIEENSRKYIGMNQNEKEVALYRVDGCLITEDKRCDYLLINTSDAIAYLVELKGSALVHAIRQIDSTLSKISTNLRGLTSINARIVLSKVNTPDLKSSDLIKLEKKLKGLNGTIKYKAKILEENL